LRASGVRWDAIALSYVDLGAAWLAGLLDGLGGLATVPRHDEMRPYVDLSGDDWDGYLATLKRSDRKEIRRRERRIVEAGGSYRLITGPAEAESGLATMFRLHDARWSERGGSTLAGAEARQQLARFATAAAAHGWLRLWLLEIQGDPAAAELAWSIGGRQVHYQAGFEPKYAGLGVGSCVFAHALREGMSAGVREADFGMGDAPYKRRFARGERTASLMIALPRWHPLRPALAVAVRGRRALVSRLSPLRGTGLSAPASPA
jgi:CelD/BcsL family acetyltransferase involved in cellulose biosynthesis